MPQETVLEEDPLLSAEGCTWSEPGLLGHDESFISGHTHISFTYLYPTAYQLKK